MKHLALVGLLSLELRRVSEGPSPSNLLFHASSYAYLMGTLFLWRNLTNIYILGWIILYLYYEISTSNPGLHSLDASCYLPVVTVIMFWGWEGGGVDIKTALHVRAFIETKT